MSPQYTNDLPPEILAEMDKTFLTEALPDDMDAEVRQQVEEQQAFCRQHPVTAIYRVAVAGSLTRRGGVADEFSTAPDDGCKIRLDNGEWASVLTVGCTVTYPDGSTAKIISGAGELYTLEERGVALVGSQLDNGDEIISTPQNMSLLDERRDVPMPVDFLVAVEGA